MLNNGEIRQLLGALHGAGRLALDADKAPLEDLDAEQYDALQMARGAALALEVVLGDRRPGEIGLQILDTLRALAKPLDGLPNDYTIRIARGVGDGVWAQTYCRDTYSSAGSPQDAATDVQATNAALLQYTDQPWRITVMAGHRAHHLAEPLYTRYEPGTPMDMRGGV